MALDCLDTLVGLSKVDYSCFGAAPDGFDTSDSGYHLTDTDYGLTVAEQCSLDGWTMLQSALNQSVMETKTDLRAKLRERFDGRLSPFRGQIAKLKSTGTVQVQKDYIGMRLRIRRQIRGAKFVFKKIYVGLNQSDGFQISITSNDPLFVPPTPISISTTANQFASATTSVELPLWSYGEIDAGDYLEYYILLARGSARPLNNTLSCCGSTPEWSQYFEAQGMSADDITSGEGLFGSQANGFVLDGYLACEELDWICDLGQLNGYYLLDVVARTIQFRGAAIAISALIDTLQVSPCTGYQLENLVGKRTFLNQRYADNIAWIAENMPSGVTDCFTCKPTNKISRSKLLV